MSAPTREEIASVLKQECSWRTVHRGWAQEIAEVSPITIDRQADAIRALYAPVVEERDRLARDLDTWVHHVPDPRAPLALHYDGCPFKPLADRPDHDMPEERPECSCAERHKGAYWKARWMLDVGQMRIERDTALPLARAALRRFIASAEGDFPTRLAAEQELSNICHATNPAQRALILEET